MYLPHQSITQAKASANYESLIGHQSDMSWTIVLRHHFSKPQGIQRGENHEKYESRSDSVIGSFFLITHRGESGTLKMLTSFKPWCLSVFI